MLFSGSRNVAKRHVFGSTMPGRIYNILAEIAVDQHGYVTTQDAEEHGVDPHRLIEMTRRGSIERVAHGVYRMPVVAPTGLEQLVEATLWPRRRGVLSHETALDVHDLCDVNPAKNPHNRSGRLSPQPPRAAALRDSSPRPRRR